ncbi:hypothetical protein EMIHUDRAFT_204775 [Emiliania huxleyi CCMP1516]|uniref:BAG domain-containing protein n=2 Tax=Emiliania huxleyi TaxID=2903 RepID=A0A0D3JWC1_EMIH1|nr:hypothetical protein EMIHUDRAFT_204775 [Emiliania huxleyi CCMP1516]EOD27806.1 hypothetical protein EMIHUDRAFT_204775 [Emiliania huxleyi CCMP1516]|eukprot:XP_005780235.1 hypothetical protein EMIHUDRAFT_204775 [Emiliania huxleyi CCMP1516]
MKLLIVVDGVRHEVVAAGSYTVAELLQRMGSTCLSGSVDGVLSLGNLILPADGSPLLSFLSRRHMYSLIALLHGVRHNAALAALGSASATLERFEAAVAAGDAPHEEELTRLFELVDAAPLDGLSEAQRGECRRRRKAIVARLEALSRSRE